MLNFLETAIAKRGGSYRSVELKSGISHSNLWRIRNGGDVRLSTLKRIATTLDMSLPELLDGESREPRACCHPEAVYACPVCGGRQEIPSGYYMAPCKVCQGTGVLWR